MAISKESKNSTSLPELNQNRWEPAIEIIEGDNYLQLKVELPGMEAKDIMAIASETEVYIKTKYPRQNCDPRTNVCHSEFHYGTFERTIDLPVAVQKNNVEAEYVHGVLTLTLPKLKA
jgi:HSP20 family protein